MTKKEDTSPYLEFVDEECIHRPYLNIVSSFLRNEGKVGNSACIDRSTLAKNIAIFGRTQSGWVPGHVDLDQDFLDPVPSAELHILILNYLDPHVVSYLGTLFSLDPGFFFSHLAGSEQHHSGRWWPSDLSKSPPPLSERLEAPYFSTTYRRFYEGAKPEEDKAQHLLRFDRRRVETCAVLRSYHRSAASRRIFGSERLSVYIRHGDVKSKWASVVIFLCDPLIPDERDENHNSNTYTGSNVLYGLPKLNEAYEQRSLMAGIVRHIQSHSHEFRGDDWFVDLLTAPLRAIAYQWTSVAQDMDFQVSASEDQLEGDFWDDQKDPRKVLTTIQRLGRRLLMYTDQVHHAKVELEGRLGRGKTGQAIQTDLDDIEEKFQALTQRAHRAVPSLGAYITMEESKKMSRLTMVALLFAPLSLIASFLSIDGQTRMGGTKYWVFIGLAIPAALLIIAFSRPFGGFRQAIGRWRAMHTLSASLGRWNAQNLT